MQALIKILTLLANAWTLAKKYPKSAGATAAAGLTGGAMMFSTVVSAPPLITAANTTNAPGANGEVLESNGDNTYTFGAPGGVGGGATELAELDDVSDTLSGAQGDFIGWDGADWDDIEVTVDTLTDVTITAAATGEVIRYNGSAWVDSALSVDDLSEVTITSLAAGEVLRYNGSSLVDATLSIDDLTEVTITTPADDQFLRYNGSNWVNETVPITVDATGITDGFVYTADGDATPAWEAPAVGGLLTPDGGTAVELADKFSVKAYGASGSPNDFHCTTSTSGTTTVSCKDSSGSARSHDFAVSQGVCIHGAGASCAISAPVLTFGGATVSYATATGTAYTFTRSGNNIVASSSAVPCSTPDPVRFTTSNTLPGGLSLATTYYLRESATAGTFSVHPTANDATNNTAAITLSDAGTGTHTMAGYTEYRYTTRAGDGYGGFTAATAEISVFNWVFDGTNVNYNQLRCHVPSQARSMAIYGSGTSSRRLRAYLEARCTRSDGTNTYSSTFAASESSGGSTKLKLTVASGHGLVANDVVYANFLSSGDTGFSGQFLIESVTATTLIMVAGTWDAGMGSATGVYEGSFVEWRDYGDNLVRQAGSGLPDYENPPMAWSAYRTYPRGNLIVDSSGRIWRNYNTFLDRESGAAEPTWTSTANARIADEDCLWEREAAFVPTNDTDGAQRQMLLTTVASTPTASTFTTTDAAGADISSNALVCQHNDALAIRATRNAIAASSHGGTIYFPAGRYNCILPEYTDTNYWTNMLNTATPRYVFLRLDNASALKSPYGISVECDQAAHIRCMMASSEGRADYTTGSQTTIAIKYFLCHGAHREVLREGLWTWDSFSGGLSEHETTSGYGGGNTFCLMVGNSGLVSSARPWDIRWENMRIHWPEIVSATSNTANDGTDRLRWKVLNCHIHVGGGSSNSFNIPKGEFEFGGGEHVLERRMGSHGFYIQGGDDEQYYHDFTMRLFGSSGANAFSCRASAGDQPMRGLRISNVHFDRVTGSIRIVDTSTSNRAVRVVLSNLTGQPTVRMAEVRGMLISNCQLGSLLFEEDIDGVSVVNSRTSTIDLTPSDRADNVSFSNVTVTGQILMANAYGTKFDNLIMKDPVAGDLDLRTALYEWIQIGATQEYYCRNRATGGDPGISSPVVVRLRDKYASATASTLGALTAGQWFYGYPDGLAGAGIPYQTLVVHMGDSDHPDPDNWPNSSVTTGTITTATVGLRFTGYVERLKISKAEITHAWPTVACTLISGSGASFNDVKIDDALVEVTNLPTTGESRLIDFSATALAQCEDFVWSRWKFKMLPAAATNQQRTYMRATGGRGGSITFIHGEQPTYGSDEWELSGWVGQIHLLGNKFQSPELLMTVDAGADTWVSQTTHPVLISTTASSMVYLMPDASFSSLPVTTPQVNANTVYYLSSTNNKLYTDSGFTSLIAVDSGATSCRMRMIEAGRISGYEHIGDAASNLDAFGTVRGNEYRGRTWYRYTQVTSNQTSFQLANLVNDHHLESNGDTIEFQGFNAPGHGMVDGREVTLYNAGTFDWILVHDSGSAAEPDQLMLPDGVNVTVTPNGSVRLRYVATFQKWTLVSKTVSLKQPEILPLYRMAQWAIEPKRYHLALAA